jgi:predicted anti-sigma-YlaC factor YlaD
MAKKRPINCDFVRPYLVDHLRGASGPFRDRIERHLGECHECGERAAFVEAFRSALPAQLPGSRLGFQKRLERVVAEAEAGVDPVRMRRRVAGRVVAAAVVAVALFGSLLPSTGELAVWVTGIGWPGAAIACLASGTVLLISSPLLITRRRQSEKLK